MRVAVSCVETRFSVVVHRGTGELMPFTPTTCEEIHRRFGGASQVTSSDPLEIQGWIKYNAFVLPCSVYRVDAPGLSWHQEPSPAGLPIIVPIDCSKGTVETNEWPVFVRHRREFWLVRPTSIPGLLRGEASELCKARRRRFAVMPSMPRPQRCCEALVIGKFAEPIVITVANGLYLLQAGEMQTAS